jgi:hypothetical protein
LEFWIVIRNTFLTRPALPSAARENRVARQPCASQRP